jgi:hypothetical protein
MKYIIIFLIAYSSSFAQLLPGGRSERYESRKSTATNKNDRAYFEIGLNGLEINNYNGVEGTITFGVIKQSNIILGGGINAVLFDSFKLNEADRNLFLRYTNGFFNFGYFIKLHNNIKISPIINLGVGRVNLTNNVMGVFADPTGDWYTFIEPKIDLDIKIYEKSHISLGTGYRNSFGIQKYGLTNEDFSTIIFKLSYKMIIE